MGVPLRDLQIAHETGQIQGGGGLADAAADLVHGFTLDIGGGGLEAPVRRPFADGSVVGEGFSAVENKAVDNLSGELNVADPPGGAGDMGLGLAQHVPEQDGLQIGGGDLRLLNFRVQCQGFPGGGAVQRFLNGGHIEVGSRLLGDDGACGGIVGGVFHLTVKPVVKLPGGEGFGGAYFHGQFYHGFRFGTVLNHILNGAAQLVICDKAAISGGGDLEKMIGQLVSHIEGVNI